MDRGTIFLTSLKHRLKNALLFFFAISFFLPQTVLATPPTVTLNASPTSISGSGDVTLTWTSTDATNCTASGGWSGSKATSGSELITGVSASTTFSITCSNSTTLTTYTSTSTPAVDTDNILQSILDPATGLLFVNTSGGSFALPAGVSVIDTHGNADVSDDELLTTYDTTSTPALLTDTVMYQTKIAFDTTNHLLYVGTYLGLSVINTQGTVSVADDTMVVTYSCLTQNGNQCDPANSMQIFDRTDPTVDDFVVDETNGLIYVGFYSGGSSVSVINTQGTPYDASDDTVQSYGDTAVGGLGYVNRILLDNSKHMLVVSSIDQGSLFFIDTQGTVSISDDTLAGSHNSTYFSSDFSSVGTSLAMYPGSNFLYVGTDVGLAAVNTQGTPDPSDDTLSFTYTTTSSPALSENNIIVDVSVNADNGFIYITSSEGLAVIDANNSGSPSDDTLSAAYGPLTSPSISGPRHAFFDATHDLLYVSQFGIGLAVIGASTDLDSASVTVTPASTPAADTAAVIPEITEIDEITADSMRLHIRVDDADYFNTETPLRIKIRNKDKDSTEYKNVTKSLGSDGTIRITVDDLDQDTLYQYTVRIEEDTPSEWSNDEEAKTLKDETEESPVSVTPETDTDLTGGIVSPNNSIIPAVPTKEKTGNSTASVNVNESTTKSVPKNTTILKDTIETIAATLPQGETQKTITAIGLVAGASTAAASGLSFLRATPTVFRRRSLPLTMFGLFMRPKKKKHLYWGVVFDILTKQALSDVRVSLTDGKGHALDNVVTDQFGRYGFLTTPGTYTIAISRGAYKLKTDSSHDSLYGPLYHGDPVVIESIDQVVELNLALDPGTFDWHTVAKRTANDSSSLLRFITKEIFWITYGVGFIFTLAVAYLFPSPFNTVMISLYVIFLVYHIVQRFFKGKSYGTLTDQVTGKPVPFAMVSLYDDSAQRIAFAISDLIGRFYLLAPQGRYKVKLSGRTMAGREFNIDAANTVISEGVLREDFEV